MLPKPSTRYVKGQVDHVDAWLMSYADFITLLFMFFIIFVSITYSDEIRNIATIRKPEYPAQDPNLGIIDLEFPTQDPRAGLLRVETPFNETYQQIAGAITLSNVDQEIAVEKTAHGLMIDMSVPLCFRRATADIRADALPLLTEIVAALKKIPPGTTIEIAAHTDDAPLYSKRFADKWELTAMQAARLASFMVDAGIASGNVHASGYADNRPIVPNADAEGNPIDENRLRNQRVVITLEKIPPTSKALGPVPQRSGETP